jgi:hypothetical protein
MKVLCPIGLDVIENVFASQSKINSVFYHLLTPRYIQNRKCRKTFATLGRSCDKPLFKNVKNTFFSLLVLSPAANVRLTNDHRFSFVWRRFQLKPICFALVKVILLPLLSCQNSQVVDHHRFSHLLNLILLLIQYANVIL